MALTAVFLIAAALGAQDTAPARVGVGITRTRLSLHEAVQSALKNNLEIEIEQTARAAARESIRAARGFLDPAVRWQPLVESRNTPTGSTLASSSGVLNERLFSQNLYFQKRAAWQGLSFQAGFENTRLSTNNPFTSLNPYVAPRLNIGFTLPLLRDRAVDRERTNLIVRRKQADVSDVEFELRVIDVVARVEQAYYDLVAVRADLDVVGESVSLARDQVDRTRRLIDSGSVAPVELAAAEAELERRKDTYFTSLSLLSQAENTLKQLLAGSRGDDVWKDEIVPTSLDRAQPAAAADELSAIVRQALERRAELRALLLRKEINESEKQGALNLRKPGLNLAAGYVSSGLAGTLFNAANPFSDFSATLAQRINQLSALQGLTPLAVTNLGGGGVPRDLVGGYGQSLTNMFSPRYASFQAGLSLDWNLRNSAAESGLAQTAITAKRLELQKRQLEQAIEAQVRNALQAIETSQQRIAAAEASARAAKEKLDSEIRLFQTGESTNFFVLTRQNEFADSRRRVVLATLELNQSVARLALAAGATLETHRIRLR